MYTFKIDGQTYKFKYYSWVDDTEGNTLHSVEQIEPKSYVIFDTHTSYQEAIEEMFKYIETLNSIK